MDRTVDSGARARAGRLLPLGLALWAALPGCRQLVGIEDLPLATDGGPIDSNPGPIALDKIDLLLVIDDSADMAEEQALLAGRLQSELLDPLVARRGALPDLHIGVIGTSVSTGFGIAGCDDVHAVGDGLLRLGEGDACAAMVHGDRFLRTTPANYDGELGAAARCLVQLGSTGCRFPQGLRATELALDGSRGENAGFLRADAVLAVFYLSNKDDCSSDGTMLFDPAATGTLGPLDSFRCVRWGVSCSPTIDPVNPMTYSVCAPGDLNPYARKVSTTANFLTGLKPVEGQVVAVAMSGPPAPFATVVGAGAALVVSPTCDTANGEALPSVRYNALLAFLSPASHFGSVCASGQGFVTPLPQLIDLIETASGR